MPEKIIKQSEFRTAVKEIYCEKKGKMRGTFAAATALPRIMFGQLRAAFKKIPDIEQPEAEVKTYMDATNGSEPALYNNADAIRDEIKATLPATSEIRSVLIAALDRAPDHAGKLASQQIVPYAKPGSKKFSLPKIKKKNKGLS